MKRISIYHLIFFLLLLFPPHISEVTSWPVRQFIPTGSAGEEVPARSVFILSFIRALGGEGDLDRDGYVYRCRTGNVPPQKGMNHTKHGWFLKEAWQPAGFENCANWLKRRYVKSYLTSLSAIFNPEEFAAHAIPLIKRDSYESFHNKVYSTAMKIANESQKVCLKKEVKKQKIKTKLK